MTGGSCFLGLWVALVPAGPAPPTPAPAPGARLILKNGTAYFLREPPSISGKRVVFTTTDGRLFSMDEREIASITAAPRSAPAPRRYDPHDSHSLGAIAKQQRDTRGKLAEVAPRSAPRRVRASARGHHPKPSPTPN